MSLAAIKDMYGVPAEKDQSVNLFIMSLHKWEQGVIIGSRGLYLKVKMLDGSVRLASPTWGIEYVQNNKENTANNSQ